LENSRLYGELQRREQQLRDFVVRLFQAQDDERRRMAYDIHDGLAQLIVSADMHLSNFASIRRDDPVLADKDFGKGLMRLKSALNEVRRVVSELRPSTLVDFGLADTVRRHLEELSADQGWEFSLKENLGDLRLDPTLETGAFRIVQESLNNVRKHSRARRVEVDLRHQGDHLHIRVRDWGTGFDPEQARQLDGHFGLRGMGERARLLGGSLEVESFPGTGTTVDVELPCYLAVPLARV
jgi:signal transduction histidine kinase